MRFSIILFLISSACTVTAKKNEVTNPDNSMVTIEQSAAEEVTKVGSVLGTIQRLFSMIDSAVIKSDKVKIKIQDSDPSNDGKMLQNPFIIAAELFNDLGVGRAYYDEKSGSYSVEFTNISLSKHLPKDHQVLIIVTGITDKSSESQYQNEGISIVHIGNNEKSQFNIFTMSRGEQEKINFSLNFNELNRFVSLTNNILSLGKRDEVTGYLEVKHAKENYEINFKNLTWKNKSFLMTIQDGHTALDKNFRPSKIAIFAELDVGNNNPLRISIQQSNENSDDLSLDLAMDR